MMRGYVTCAFATRKVGFHLGAFPPARHHRQMRRAFVLLGFIALVFGAGALLSPGIYWLIQRAGIAPDLSFNRVVSRMLLVLALAGVWPLMKLLGATPGNIG